MGTQHIALLGDSVFDNKVYVAPAPPVIEHLKKLIPTPWKATLCAVDGHTTVDIRGQIPKVPADASHLFVSVGGNDALRYLNLLSDLTKPGPILLRELSKAAQAFRANYAAAVAQVHGLSKPTWLCTIYNGNLGPELAEAAACAVAVFNDAIYSVAHERHLPVIELRNVCNQPSDYANPIEPSSNGGQKIARAISELATGPA